MTQEMTTTNGNAVAISADDLALMAGDRSTRVMEAKSLITPQLRLVQTTSGYAKRSHADYIPGATEGMFIDTLTRQLRDNVRILVCEERVTYTEWEPDQGGLVKQWGTDPTGYNNAEGDFGTRKTADGNDIVPAETYYCLLLTDDEGGSLPVVLYLTGTQFKKARRLNTLLTTFELKGPDGPFTAPFWARAFDCSAVPESKGENTWMGWKIEPGPLTLTLPGGRNLYTKAKLFAEAVNRDEVQAAPPVDRDAPAATEGRREDSRPVPGGGVDEDIPF